MRMSKVLVATFLIASVTLAAEALGQMQTRPPTGQRPPPPGAEAPAGAEDKIVEGQVQSINPSGTEIVLTDGTRLVAPPGAKIRPGALTEGAIVLARYKEENGNKVLTGLAVAEPSASPPSGSRPPAGPPPATPRDSPKRY